MKKLLALLLAVMMIASMSITAFATGASNLGDAGAISGDTSKDVTITMTNAENADTVYYVVVTWETLSFNYTFADGSKWDPENHQYNAASGSKWDKTEIANAITVFNHSNASVTVDAAFVTDGGKSNSKEVNNVNATVTCNSDSETIGSAEGKTTTDESLKITYNVTIEDKVPSTNEDFTLGTITVELSHN